MNKINATPNYPELEFMNANNKSIIGSICQILLGKDRVLSPFMNKRLFYLQVAYFTIMQPPNLHHPDHRA